VDAVAVVIPFAAFVVVFAALLPAARRKDALRGSAPHSWRYQLLLIAVLIGVVFAIVFSRVGGASLAVALAAAVLVFVAASAWTERRFGPGRPNR
jgi:cobalamin synthase